eukprot:1142300-Pelagomonas_calceolata.AAC.3
MGALVRTLIREAHACVPMACAPASTHTCALLIFERLLPQPGTLAARRAAKQCVPTQSKVEDGHSSGMPVNTRLGSAMQQTAIQLLFQNVATLIPDSPSPSRAQR